MQYLKRVVKRAGDAAGLAEPLRQNPIEVERHAAGNQQQIFSGYRHIVGAAGKSSGFGE